MDTENEPISEMAILPFVDVVKKEWKKDNVITFLQRDDLNLDLDDEDIEIIRSKKVSGKDFLGLTAEKLENYGLQPGPASRIAELVKEIKGEQAADQPPRKLLFRDLGKDEEMEPEMWSKQLKELNKELSKGHPNIIDRKIYTPGVSDFTKFITTSSTFVDKSLFIMEFMFCGAQASLITRPRRFGKSTNLSMLNDFLAPPLTEEERTRRFNLFKNLRIFKFNRFMELNFGKWPVIHISFKDLNGDSWHLMLKSIKLRISDLYGQHRYIIDNNLLETADDDFFNKIINGTTDQSVLTNSLSRLARYLHKCYNKSSVILIDEYDWPMEYVKNKDYEKINSLFRSMYSNVAKDNPHVHKVLFVGLLPLGQATFLSGLNNVEHFSMHKLPSVHQRACFSDSFGFTEEEVNALIKGNAFGVTLNRLSIHYNGYKTSIGTHIYNPYSIISFLDSGVIGDYWVNSGSAKTLVDCLKRCDRSIEQQLNTIFYSFYSKQTDEQTDKQTDEFIEAQLLSCLRYNTIKKELNIDAIYTLLYYSGYLAGEIDGGDDRLKGRVVERWGNKTKVKLRIPNREVAEQWRLWINQIIDECCSTINNNLYNLLFEKDIKTFCRNFPTLFMEMISCFDIADAKRTKLYENWYHVFVLGALAMYHGDDYQVLSNREVGKGRADIRIIPINSKNDICIIFEFKLAESEDYDEMKDKAVEGLNQIDEKYYRANIPSYVKTIVEVAIAFYKKSAFVSGRVLQHESSSWKISLSAESEPQKEVSDSSYTVNTKRKLDLEDNGDDSTQKSKKCKGMNLTGKHCNRNVTSSDFCYQHSN